MLSSPDGDDDEPMLKLLMKEMKLISQEREQRKQKKKMQVCRNRETFTNHGHKHAILPIPQRSADDAVSQVQAFLAIWSEESSARLDKPAERAMAKYAAHAWIVI